MLGVCYNLCMELDPDLHQSTCMMHLHQRGVLCQVPPCRSWCVSTNTISKMRIWGFGSRSPIFFIGLFSIVFQQMIFSPWFGFLAHSFLIPDLELRLQRLVETLYCIVKILYNAMKETKRAVNLSKMVFPFGISRVISMYCVCECHCLIFYFS